MKGLFLFLALASLNSFAQSVPTNSLRVKSDCLVDWILFEDYPFHISLISKADGKVLMKKNFNDQVACYTEQAKLNGAIDQKDLAISLNRTGYEFGNGKDLTVVYRANTLTMDRDCTFGANFRKDGHDVSLKNSQGKAVLFKSFPSRHECMQEAAKLRDAITQYDLFITNGGTYEVDL